MVKLLIVTTVPATLESFLLPYAAHLRSKGWRVDALAAGATSSGTCAQAFDQVWDATWSRNPLAMRGLLGIKHVRRLLETEHYDVVHVHTPVAAFLTRLAAARLRRKGLRVVYTAHGLHFLKGQKLWRNAPYLALERVAGRWTDRLVVINEEDFQAARRHRLVPDDRLVRMHGIGVDTSIYSRASVKASTIASIREELALDDGEPLLLMVAEFNANKRQQLVLDALALGDLHAVVAFAGDGPLRETAAKYARTKGIEARTRFLGHRNDIPALLAASAATLIVSRREGLPRSSMESLSMGVPVIGTDIRGVRDLLEGGCGVLVASNDPGALARAMRWVLEHPAEASAMGARGREKMSGEYEIGVLIDAHDRLYTELTES